MEGAITVRELPTVPLAAISGPVVDSDVVVSPGAEQLVIAELNREHGLARSHRDAAVQHAIRCGQILLAVRKRLRRGEFGQWIECNCMFRRAAATRYMAAATLSATGVAIESLSSVFPSGRRIAQAIPASQKNEHKVLRPAAPSTPGTTAEMTADQAVEILRRQPNSARDYARLVQRYRVEKRALAKAQRDFDNTVLSVLAAARKIEMPKAKEVLE